MHWCRTQSSWPLDCLSAPAHTHMHTSPALPRGSLGGWWAAKRAAHGVRGLVGSQESGSRRSGFGGQPRERLTAWRAAGSAVPVAHMLAPRGLGYRARLAPSACGGLRPSVTTHSMCEAVVRGGIQGCGHWGLLGARWQLGRAWESHAVRPYKAQCLAKCRVSSMSVEHECRANAECRA